MKIFWFIASLLFFSSCHSDRKATAIKEDVDYAKALELYTTGKDSAFYYFNKVAVKGKDRLEAAMSLNYMGQIQSAAGDHFGSQESLTQSLKLLDPKDTAHRKCLSSDYNELGLASVSLRQYAAALNFFDSALQFAPDSAYRRSFLNNKALALQKKGAYNEAIAIYDNILVQTARKTSYARILSNRARTKWLRNRRFLAAPELLQALQIREAEQDLWGQNASFIHLAEYYGHRQPDSAYYYANREYDVARKLQSPDDVLEALEKLIRFGPPGSSKTYFERYYQLDDSLQSTRNAAKNQFAFIRYEAEKHKADNLRLERDNIENRYQIIRQWVLISACMLVIACGIFWYRRRKQRMARETEKTLKENELRLSRKVHDVVANGIYRVMSEVEYNTALDREDLLDQLEAMYEQSRDISYEKPLLITSGYAEELKKHLEGLKGPAQLILHGNEDTLWDQVKSDMRHQLEIVLHEFLVNMSKHSQADLVMLGLEKKNKQLTIDYRDNGVGMNHHKGFGTGLRSTVSRIEQMNGEITFAVNGPSGLWIHISLPLV